MTKKQLERLIKHLEFLKSCATDQLNESKVYAEYDEGRIKGYNEALSTIQYVLNNK